MLVDRRRPPTSAVAKVVPGLPKTKTSSFPSGHTASAFAFAVGAGSELPALAPLLGGLALAVGYSRVHTGAHHPSDVAGGAVLGAAVGLVTRRLWPVAPHAPARARTAPAGADVPPLPGGRGLTVVINPSAGTPLGESPAEAVRQALPEAEVVELEDADDLGEALKTGALRSAAIGVAGGDGSINAAAEIASRHGRVLLVIPGGTLNHFARDLGLESPEDALGAVGRGEAVAVDLAEIDGRAFVNTASFGSYVELVDARERLEKKLGKWPALVVALVRVLRGSEPVEVEIDGERKRIWMSFIGNCRYHPAGFAPSWRERLDDGQLDVRLVDASQPWSRGRLLVSVLTGRLARCRAYEQRYTRELRVRSLDGPLRLARDGETFEGSTEFTVTKCRDPLVVFLPKP